jgi:hypothetical protein
MVQLASVALVGGLLMKRVTMFLSAGMIIGTVAVLAARSQGGDDPKSTKIRIGTYDNRAISLAFFASRFNPTAEKKAAYEKAKAAGDQAKMKELEEWGPKFQRQLHFQTFGRAPVDDLLEPVKDRIAKLAGDKQLAAITMNCDFTSEQVELVDVTEDLVKLYDPDPLDKTLQGVREIRKIKPTPLTELADHKD